MLDRNWLKLDVMEFKLIKMIKLNKNLFEKNQVVYPVEKSGEQGFGREDLEGIVIVIVVVIGRTTASAGYSIIAPENHSNQNHIRNSK